jgi:peptide deformylase
MVHDIVIYPDRRLKLVSKKIEQFDETLHALLDDMYETMIAKNGVGLAAIQIGVAKRVLIINVPIDTEDEEIETQPKENTLEIINPVITYRSEEMIKFQEGCLSIPSIYEDIERHAMVTIEYQDRFGKQQVIEDDEFLAIALQHEIDHLDGKLFIEKLSYIKRKKFEKEWKKRDKN